jgi:hypothetical protein
MDLLVSLAQLAHLTGFEFGIIGEQLIEHPMADPIFVKVSAWKMQAYTSLPGQWTMTVAGNISPFFSW